MINLSAWILDVPNSALQLISGLIFSGVFSLLLVQRRRIGCYIMYAFYTLWLSLAAIKLLLIDFTGRGYTNDVFYHIEIESFRMGFIEYYGYFIVSIVSVTLLLFIIAKLRDQARLQVSLSINSLLFVVLGLSSYLSPMGEVLTQYYNYQSYSINEVISPEKIAIYAQTNIIQSEGLVQKRDLEVRKNSSAKNLIFVYLESFSGWLVDNDRYPNLTPFIDELSTRYQTFSHISSAYVTIEGIISSQCGILLPMSASNNTFMKEQAIMDSLPCLADVLHEADYTQYYLGGADMEFAGKGRFLKSHGYDFVWGLGYWTQQGFKQRAGVWGLSDSELFEQALKTIRKAHKNPPYNVTLLTLGTHIPGYVYEGCPEYDAASDRFVNAVHCTDYLLGNFIESLERENLLDNALLVVIADHGIFPNPDMRKLFGDQVTNRQLIGLTNSKSALPDTPVSSYDIAPSVLDLLEINHNAKFLFGMSVFDDNKINHKHTTRYGDWLGLEIVANNKGDCIENQPVQWPMNACEKRQLLKLTNSILSQYTRSSDNENLACDLSVSVNLVEMEGSVKINGVNHFKHFYQGGRFLKAKKVESGIFLFEIDGKDQIINHLYYPFNKKGMLSYDAFKKSSQAVTSLTIARYKNAEELALNLGLTVDFEPMLEDGLYVRLLSDGLPLQLQQTQQGQVLGSWCK